MDLGQDELADWGLDQDTVTVEQFDKAIEELYELKKVCDEKKALSEAANKEYAKKEAEITKLLEVSNRDSYSAKHGTVRLSMRASYKTPKLREDKEKLFDWIKNNYDEDTMWAYITINSQTLNSFCKKEIELAAERGEEFKPDGLEEPTKSVSLSYRSK